MYSGKGGWSRAGRLFQQGGQGTMRTVGMASAWVGARVGERGRERE